VNLALHVARTGYHNNKLGGFEYLDDRRRDLDKRPAGERESVF
jgi:hypothetical protein